MEKNHEKTKKKNEEKIEENQKQKIRNQFKALQINTYERNPGPFKSRKIYGKI